jgi:predicted RNase H-like nuclease (RuvC/YqgF family)
LALENELHGLHLEKENLCCDYICQVDD